MKKILLSFIIITATLFCSALSAQVTIGAQAPPDPSAVLDLQSNEKFGLLLPRVVLTDTLVAAPLAAHVKGMFVYNTTPSDDGKVAEGVYYNDGNRWWQINGGQNSGPGPWQMAETTNPAASITDNIYQMGQVGIGTAKPDVSAALDVESPDSDNPRGLLIPRMSQTERDNIKAVANGLMIFNTDENCFNYYDAQLGEWTSLCGGVPTALGAVDCNNTTVNGIYVVTTTMNSGNYLSVPVKITKPGMYTITATPGKANGYYFTSSGSFANAGNYVVNLAANGAPIYAQNDTIDLTFNGIEAHCSSLIIQVSPLTPDYTITGVTVVPNIYPIHSTLNAADDYLAVTLNVKAPGKWSLSTNMVNGYQFSAQGDISRASGFNPNGTFPQTVTVIVPVTGGQALSYGTGQDNFILSNSGSTSVSTYPFTVNLAGVGFSADCATAQFSGATPMQNLNLTKNQTITLPVTVETPGETIITASGGGMVFSSGTIDLTGKTSVTLIADSTTAPSTSGTVNLAIKSAKGGITSACYIPVTVSPATVNISTMTLAGIDPGSGNYIIDVNGNIPVNSVSLSVVSTTAGEYNITTDPVNGVTFSGSGQLIASTSPQTIKLVPSGTPTAVAGTQTYTVTLGSNTVTFNINYVYRAMNIMVLGSSTYQLPNFKNYLVTSASGNTTSNADLNFGVNGKIPTAGVKLTVGTAGAGSLATQINSKKYDIILTGYNNGINAADVTAAVSYVNNNGVLFIATETGNGNNSSSGNSVEAILAQLFGVTVNTSNSSALWYSNSTNLGLFRVGSDKNDPILGGPFYDITGTLLANDNNSLGTVMSGTLPATAIALATQPSGASCTPSQQYFAVRHSNKAFVWSGDGGFWRDDGNNTSASSSSPIGTNPTLPKLWNYTNNSGLSGNQQVYNGQFLLNFFGYAIKYAATNARQ